MALSETSQPAEGPEYSDVTLPEAELASELDDWKLLQVVAGRVGVNQEVSVRRVMGQAMFANLRFFEVSLSRKSLQLTRKSRFLRDATLVSAACAVQPHSTSSHVSPRGIPPSVPPNRTTLDGCVA